MNKSLIIIAAYCFVGNMNAQVVHLSAKADTVLFEHFEEIEPYIKENGDQVTALYLSDFKQDELNSISSLIDVSKIELVSFLTGKTHDVEFLKDFINLKKLYFLKVSEIDIDFLPRSLVSLSFRYQPRKIKNVQLLDSFDKLENLEFVETCSCKYLRGFTRGLKLKTLLLGKTPVAGSSCFFKQPTLKVLTVHDANGRDVSFLSTLLQSSTLREVYISKLGTFKDEDWEKIRSLEIIKLSNCNVSTLPNLMEFPNLSKLDLSQNKIQGSCTLSIKNPISINLSGNAIDSLYINSLKSKSLALDVSHNSLKWIDGVESFSEKLVAFYFAGNPYIQMGIDDYFPNMESFSFAPQTLNIKVDLEKIATVYNFTEEDIHYPKKVWVIDRTRYKTRNVLNHNVVNYKIQF